MYHFTAEHSPEPVRLSFRALIPGYLRQYLKDFQLDAIRFMYNFLAKGEFFVYNDESGLGKQAAVVVLLDAVCSSRKCLIVVQNDDRYLSGWEFHFNVLTKTSITVIKNENDTTESPHSIYIAKWSTLRTIDDLSKFSFDFIILDNRGQMLNNSFCMSMLLKHYERKVNILISSVDITSDLKLFHNVLRLGGRLDPQYSSFKVFEDKFKLPDAKELAYKRVDLEEYFCKRERLADYCKYFRLKRYCHQFEDQLPLVKEDRYKISLELWREKQNATSSESSSVEYVNHNNEHKRIKDTQELSEEYCKQKRKQHLQLQYEEKQRLKNREQEISKSLQFEKHNVYNVDDEVALINDTPTIVTDQESVSRDTSDETVLMSPLLVESDSDPEDIPQIYNDPNTDIEVVDLSSEEKEKNSNAPNEDEGLSNHVSKKDEHFSKNFKGNKEFSKKRSFKKSSELERLKENIADTLKIMKMPKRTSRQFSLKVSAEVSNERTMDRLAERRTFTRATRTKKKIPKSLKRTCNVNLTLKSKYNSAEKSAQQKKQRIVKKNRNYIQNVNDVTVKKDFTSPDNTKKVYEKKLLRSCLANTASKVSSGKKGGYALKNKIHVSEANNRSTLPSINTKSLPNVENISNETKAKILGKQTLIKLEVAEEMAHQSKINDEKGRSKRETEMSPVGQQLKRVTRSASGGKYLTKNLSLQIDKINKFKNKPCPKETPKSIEANKNEKLIHDGNSKSKNKKSAGAKNSSAIINSQTSIISHRTSQDYEFLQCAQRLSGAYVFDNGIERSNAFLIPPTPSSLRRNSLIPLSFTPSVDSFTQSDGIGVHSFKPNNAATKNCNQIISISSSENEVSTSQSSTTNVSMTSRRTRALKPKRHEVALLGGTKKMPNFTDLLAQQNARSTEKSPDLFSNCSDLIQLPCTQQNVDNVEPNTPFEGFKIFGSEVKQLQQHYALKKKHNANQNNPNSSKAFPEQRSCLDILEKMFDPSNKKAKQNTAEKTNTPPKKFSREIASATNKQKTHSQILPSHPTEAIAEARQQQELRSRKSLQDDDIFEISNNGIFGSVMRLHSNGDVSPVQNSQKANKQHNKITNYLIGNATQTSCQEESNINGGNSAINSNTEAGTPSNKQQQVVNVNIKKSPKSKGNITQTTKLTKWFTKPTELRSHASTSVKAIQRHQEVELALTTSQSPPPTGKRILKRRRLDL